MPNKIKVYSILQTKQKMTNINKVYQIKLENETKKVRKTIHKMITLNHPILEHSCPQAIIEIKSQMQG